MTLSRLNMLFCKISLNDNQLSGPVVCPTSSLCADIFICSIKADVTAIKFPIVGHLEFISKKKNLRCFNKKLPKASEAFQGSKRREYHCKKRKITGHLSITV